MMKVALVYDRVNTFGGAERVLSVLSGIWPDAPLFTSIYDPDGAQWAKALDVQASWLSRVPWFRSRHEALGWLMPVTFETLDVSGFDVVISVTSEAAKAVLTVPRQLHVCYLLTPTRYLWSHQLLYRQQVSAPLRPLVAAIQSRLRTWDFIAAQRPDAYLAVSERARVRCQQYYRRESKVIYPPMVLEGSEGVDGPERLKNYYLVVSRLVPYKRIDLAIEACNRLNANLVIVGRGTDETRLKSLAGATVRFVGQLTDRELVRYYQRAKAVLMPQDEDLGLVAIEAQAFGVPVVTYRYSGASEVVLDGQTGVVFDRQDVQSLTAAIRRLLAAPLEPAACRAQAAKFSRSRFVRTFRSTIERLWDHHQSAAR